MGEQALEAVEAPSFGFDGRGPVLRRWVHDDELWLPGSSQGYAPPTGQVCGAVYEGPRGPAFVLFWGAQVLQLTSHEVHSHWHRRQGPRAGVLRVRGSTWLASSSPVPAAGLRDEAASAAQLPGTSSPVPAAGLRDEAASAAQLPGTFQQRHLRGHEHFVLEWYDELAEVICRDLIFGEGEFELERVLAREPRLGGAYLRHALSQRALGNAAAAKASLERYLACAPHVNSVDYARRLLAEL